MTDQPDQLKLVKIVSCRVYTRGVSFLKGTLCSVDDITASDHYPSCKWIKLATTSNFGLHDRYGELVKAGILRTDTIRFDSDSVLMGDVIVTLLRMASVDAYKGTIYPSYGNQTPNTTQPANPHKETDNMNGSLFNAFVVRTTPTVIAPDGSGQIIKKPVSTIVHRKDAFIADAEAQAQAIIIAEAAQLTPPIDFAPVDGSSVEVIVKKLS